ncbi:MAG: site-2 protease family protein [Rhodomicrobiaceae bacterium]
MFTNSYRLFSILGFRISVDVSLVFLAALIVWSLGSGVFPDLLPGLSMPAYYAMGAVTAVGMFASIVFHELAHALVASYYRIKIAGITLFIFGGVAELEDEPPTAKSEFLVAVAGPISSYVLAGALYLLLDILPLGLPRAVFVIVSYLMLINLILATFNMIPAFPLDGGRMLRAGLWWLRGDLNWATRIASFLGAGLGGALMAFGAYNAFLGNMIGGMWQILIGFFIVSAARGARRQMEALETLRGVNVDALMRPVPSGIPADVTVAQVLGHPDLAGSTAYYPVADNGAIVGLVQPAALAKLSPQQQAATTLRQAAKPLKREERVDAGQSTIGALSQLRRARGNQAFVFEGGHAVGWIRAGDIFEHIDRQNARKAAANPAE